MPDTQCAHSAGYINVAEAIIPGTYYNVPLRCSECGEPWKPTATPRRIYVASSWRCRLQPSVVQALRGQGHEVYDFRNPPGKTGFAWSEIDPGWLDWTIDGYRDCLDHPRAIDGYGADFAAMQWADTFVLVLPCGRSAHLEMGWAVGQGKDTAILLSQEGFEPELMYRMVDKLTTSLDELLAWTAAR